MHTKNHHEIRKGQVNYFLLQTKILWIKTCLSIGEFLNIYAYKFKNKLRKTLLFLQLQLSLGLHIRLCLQRCSQLYKVSTTSQWLNVFFTNVDVHCRTKIALKYHSMRDKHSTLNHKYAILKNKGLSPA